MKKIIFIFLFLFSFSSVAAAAVNVPSTSVYWSALDQYRVDYVPPKLSVAFYELNFYGANGQYYHAVYNFAPTGIHYLTCNGDYNLKFYDSSGGVIASTSQIQTTLIKNPTCSSYPNTPQGRNDLNINVSQGDNGNANLSWDKQSGAVTYQIWKDGQLVGTTDQLNYQTPGNGQVTVVAVDSNGNELGKSDVRFDESDYKTCADLVCQCISQLKDINAQILDSVRLTNGLLATLNATATEINNNVLVSNDLLRKLLEQITPTISIGYAGINDDFKQRLENYKPDNLPSQKFEDNTVYFNESDYPVIESPPPLPKPPEPDDHWTLDGNQISKELPLKPDLPMNKDRVMNKDQVLKKDLPMQKDSPLQKEPVNQRSPSMSRDGSLQREPSMSKDPVNQRSNVNQRDGTLNRDSNLNKDPSLKREPAFQREPVVPFVHW